MPSSMRIVVAPMPSSEVAVSKDVVTGSLKENCSHNVPSCNHCQCKKDKAIHSYFHHISDTSIPNSFVRYTTDVLKSNIVVFDGSTNDQDNIEQPTVELPFPWISLSIKNQDLFIQTIHNGTQSMGLKYCIDDGITKFALLPRKMVINSTVLKSGDRLYQKKICDALDDLEHAQQKSFQRGNSCYVITENTHKYYIAGVQPICAEIGISLQTYYFPVCLIIPKTL